MKEGWEYRIFESCLVKVPKQVQVKSKDYKKEGKYPIVSQEAELISGYWDDETIVYKHKDPVVIFGDHTKNIKYIDFNFVVGADGTHILSTKNDISPKFFYYVLKSIKLRELGYARHYKLLKEKFIPVPPLSEQLSIVDYLDSAFAKIDAMKANAEKALNEAKALFQASLQGNSYVNSDGILFVTSENVREGRLEFNPKKFVDNSFNIKQCRSILKKFDILVNIVGASIGRAAVFDLDVENANINQAVCLIRLDWDKLLPAYLCFFLNSEHAFKQYVSMVKDTARANLSLENIGSLEICIPPLSEQQSIVATLDSLKSKVDRLQANYEKISQECDALKQSILRQVFE